MNDHLSQHLQSRKEQSYALRMLGYEMQVGFLKNSDKDITPRNIVDPQAHTRAEPNTSTALEGDSCVAFSDHLSFESQITTEDQIFFDGVKALCVHHFGEIGGTEKFEILCEAYVSSIDNASRVSNLKARKIEAKRDLIKQLDDLVQFAKLATQRVKAEDVRTIFRFFTTALAFGAAFFHWLRK